MSERKWEPNEAIREFVRNNGREPEALCPDRQPCWQEDEWGHPCDRNEQGQYECYRSIAALRERSDEPSRSAFIEGYNVGFKWGKREGEDNA